MSETTVCDDIVVLERDGDQYFEHDVMSAGYLNNAVPAVGDRLSLHLGDESGIAVYQIEDRYLADTTYLSGGQVNESFWVLIVRQIDEDHFFNLDDILRGIQRHGFGNTWRGKLYPLQVAETLIQEEVPLADIDRDNRDPNYWTLERKKLLRQEREARLAAIKAGREPKD